MRATFKAYPSWPYPDSPKQVERFGTSQRGIALSNALLALDEEIGRIGGRDVLIGCVTDEANLTLDGRLRGNAKMYSPGAEVSFDTQQGRLAFHTNAFAHFASNVYAIARGLAALRLIDRYGITQAGQQYEGWKALPAGDAAPDAERGRLLANEAGGLRQAIKHHHPDNGGSARDLADVLAYKSAIGA